MAPRKDPVPGGQSSITTVFFGSNISTSAKPLKQSTTDFLEDPWKIRREVWERMNGIVADDEGEYEDEDEEEEEEEEEPSDGSF
ncbi:hypothetical protein MY3957_007443 [Beauveria namnaoensis]